VACIGENSYTETPGNLTDLWLSENQRNLVKALAKTGKPIVLVLNEGRPRLIADIEPLAKGIIDILIPGNYGGDALANLVSGKSNFSGKMPYTYPKEINSLANYDFKKSEEVGTMEGAYDYNAKITQQWGFGQGLSYTSYQYSNLKVSKSDFRHGDLIQVSVDVKNTGKVAGKESVLLFSSDLIASMVPDGRRLRAFDKVELQPGETKTVAFDVPVAECTIVDSDANRIVEPGEFEIMIGASSKDIRLSERLLVDDGTGVVRLLYPDDASSVKTTFPAKVSESEDVTAPVSEGKMIRSLGINWGPETDCSFEILWTNGGGQFLPVYRGRMSADGKAERRIYDFEPVAASEIRVAVTKGSATILSLESDVIKL